MNDRSAILNPILTDRETILTDSDFNITLSKSYGYDSFCPSDVDLKRLAAPSHKL
ncbi:MAG: hypothetical protein WBA16_06655 [Nonlabens sp.]